MIFELPSTQHDFVHFVMLFSGTVASCFDPDLRRALCKMKGCLGAQPYPAEGRMLTALWFQGISYAPLVRARNFSRGLELRAPVLKMVYSGVGLAS